MSKKHTLTRWSGLLAASAILFAACSTPAGTAAPSAASAAPPGSAAPSAGSAEPGASAAAGPSAELIAAAKAEGGLTTIALPRDWCNYGEVIDSFTAKYGIPINGLTPGGSSATRSRPSRPTRTIPGRRRPTSSMSASPRAGGRTTDLLEPYKVSTWDTIPDSAKAADGNWFGDYYGVIVVQTNPPSQANAQGLGRPLKPEYKGQVALTATRRRQTRRSRPCGPQHWRTGVHSTMSSRASTSSSRSIDAGNFVPVDAGAAAPSVRVRPRSHRWSYNGLST